MVGRMCAEKALPYLDAAPKSDLRSPLGLRELSVEPQRQHPTSTTVLKMLYMRPKLPLSRGGRGGEAPGERVVFCLESTRGLQISSVTPGTATTAATATTTSCPVSVILSFLASSSWHLKSEVTTGCFIFP